MKLLFVGDVVGGHRPPDAGRAAARACASEHRPDFVVVNGENAAGGVGITRRRRASCSTLGVDAITLGNHAYRHREVYEYLDTEPRIVPPGELSRRAAPAAATRSSSPTGMRLGVINLSGQVFLEAVRSPFAEADALLAELRDKADAVLVDMHAEATSEKVAMGWHLDGRVTRVRRAPTPTCRPPTRGCCPAAPPT